MTNPMLDRTAITQAFIAGLKPLDHVLAFWEAGSIAFGRSDKWSDLDLCIAASDDQIEPVMQKIGEIVDGLGGYDLVHRLPEPTWHGHSQVFYRLKNASPFLFIDAVAIKESSHDKFLQFAIHGKPVVHFDKKGIVKDDPIDIDAFIERLKARVDFLKTTFELYKVLTLKELNRHKDIIAFPYYFAMTLRPLIEVLRITHAPHHYNFFTAYIDHDLPAEIYQRLQKFFFVPDGLALLRAHTDACAWFQETIEHIDFGEVRKKLAAPQR